MMTIKKVAKSTTLCIVLLFLFAGTGLVPVFAETTSQDGLEVVLETNKEEYTSDEQIDVTLTVTNTNDFSVANLSLENQIPEGYKLVNDTVASKQMESLAAGEKVSLVSSIAPNKSSGGSDNKQNSDKTTTITDDKNASNNSKNTTATSSKTSTDTNGKKEKNKSFSIVDTGDGSKMYFWIGLLVVGIVGASVFVAIKYKNRKAMLMLLSMATAGMAVKVTTINLNAEEMQDKSVPIIKIVKVGGKDLELNSVVEYKLAESKDDLNANEYYKENSEIIEIIDVESDTNLLSESEAISLLENRGFDGLKVNYDYSIEGTFLDDTLASSTSEVKHPMYTTYYMSTSSELWTIYIIENVVMAYPVSFNFVSDFESELLVAESENVMSYESHENLFYLTKPKSSGAQVKIVEKINKETLDSLTVEELEK